MLQKSDVPGLVDRVLSAIGTWRRLAMLVCLAALGFVGNTLYESRHDIALSVVARFAAPEIDTKKTPELLSKLQKKTGSGTAAVWSVSMQKNQRQLLTAVMPDGVHSDHLTETVLDWGTQQSKTFLTALEDKIACGALDGTDAISQAAMAKGDTWECVAAVPQQYGDFIGLLVLTFMAPPENLSAVRLQMREMAEEVLE